MTSRSSISPRTRKSRAPTISATSTAPSAYRDVRTLRQPATCASIGAARTARGRSRLTGTDNLLKDVYVYVYVMGMLPALRAGRHVYVDEDAHFRPRTRER